MLSYRLAILLLCCGPVLCRGQATSPPQLRFPAPNATQAVAVDSLYFYAISNSRIVKHRREDGSVVGEWSGPLEHLNSGIVLDGKLYCANTNFPKVPMASSLEIFDTEIMTHVGSHSFGHYLGSFTWIDRWRGDWYLMFVHYDETGRERELGVEYTTLVRMDEAFRRTAGWTIPDSLSRHIAPMSISGGVIRDDGTLLLSPHHYREVYQMRFPKMGYELEWTGTISVPMEGQGIAADPLHPDWLWGIDRRAREVVVGAGF